MTRCHTSTPQYPANRTHCLKNTHNNTTEINLKNFLFAWRKNVKALPLLLCPKGRLALIVATSEPFGWIQAPASTAPFHGIFLLTASTTPPLPPPHTQADNFTSTVFSRLSRPISISLSPCTLLRVHHPVSAALTTNTLVSCRL